MDDIAKAALAISHSFLAVGIAAAWPSEMGILVGAFVAYLLVFY